VPVEDKDAARPEREEALANYPSPQGRGLVRPVHGLYGGRGARGRPSTARPGPRWGGKLAKALSDRQGGLVFDDEGLRSASISTSG
jgi:hypothetical protein